MFNSISKLSKVLLLSFPNVSLFPFCLHMKSLNNHKTTHDQSSDKSGYCKNEKAHSKSRVFCQILLKLNPFSCQICKSPDYYIEEVNPDKNWIHQYIGIPNCRSPSKASNILSTTC